MYQKSNGLKAFLKYPLAFYYLCLATMCEKFSFHAIRFSNVVYMTKGLLLSDSDAYLISGSTLALTFMFPVVGGWLGGRFLGYYRVCLIGAFFMALGIGCLLLPYKFPLYGGMGLVSCGGGFLRCGIPALASLFFENNREKRDSGYTILYSFVNTGAFFAVFGSCVIGEIFGWHYNFIISSCVALLSLFFLKKGSFFFNSVENNLPHQCSSQLKIKNLRVYGYSVFFPLAGSIMIFFNGMMNYLLSGLFLAALIYVFYKAYIQKDQRNNFLSLGFCMLIQVVFFSIYEQGASSVSLFIDRNVNKTVYVTWDFLKVFFPMDSIPTLAFQAIDPLVNMVLGAILGYLWFRLAKYSTFFSFLRFGLGLIMEATAFFLLTCVCAYGHKTGLVDFWIIPFIYLFTVTGELLVVPLGMSMVSNMGSLNEKGLLLGFWNLSIALGQWGAGVVSCYTSMNQDCIDPHKSIKIYGSLFSQISLWGFITGLVIITLSVVCFKPYKK